VPTKVSSLRTARERSPKSAEGQKRKVGWGIRAKEKGKPDEREKGISAVEKVQKEGSWWDVGNHGGRREEQIKGRGSAMSGEPSKKKGGFHISRSLKRRPSGEENFIKFQDRRNPEKRLLVDA